MAKILYQPKRFSKGHANVVAKADSILQEYSAQGLVLTLRQLYYQFVARGLVRNNQKQYKRLGAILVDARLAGKIDWDMLEDRSRNLATLQHFSGPQHALDLLASWYHVDMWKDQQYRPEVWIEKDALSGVIRGVCEENDVPFFSCRGYTSISEMYRAAVRLTEYRDRGQQPYIIHLGDHDPSGIDMSRDIFDRLQKTFMSPHEFTRVALTMEQVREYDPPPNPAKVTDSRFKKYRDEYGEESWELDALQPTKFRELIEEQLASVREDKAWAKSLKEKAEVKSQLTELAGDWGSVQSNKKKMVELERSLSKKTVEVGRLSSKIETLSTKVMELEGRLAHKTDKKRSK